MVTGTHILINATSTDIVRLKNNEQFKEFILKKIEAHQLFQVGSVFHSFSNGGFTGVVCLTESHLAVHTWPELNYYTADIYLCDYSRNNNNLAHDMCNEIKSYFSSTNIKEQIITR